MTVSTYKTEMPEHASVSLEMGASEGNSTLTSITLSIGAGTWEFIAHPQGMKIIAHGDWEREGLVNAFEFLAHELRAGLKR